MAARLQMREQIQAYEDLVLHNDDAHAHFRPVHPFPVRIVLSQTQIATATSRDGCITVDTRRDLLLAQGARVRRNLRVQRRS